MAEVVGIYARVAASRIRAQYQYRLSFALQVLGSFLLSFLDFIAILVMFVHLDRLAGWDLGEIAFLYGSTYISFRIADMIFANVEKVPLLIRMGSFDQVLTRPLGSLGQVLTGEVDIRHMGAVLQGVGVFSFGLSRVQIEWTVGKGLVLASMLLSGIAIYGCLWVITNSVSFWITDAREVANAFTYGGNALTQFPMPVYARWMRRLLGLGLGLAFVSYYPALYLLGKSDPEVPPFLRFASPLVAMALAGVTAVVWRSAVRHYRSTGS